MPAVTVLMVFHRDAPFLRAAIGSVLGQTMADFELVLVDNGAGLSVADLGEAGRDPRVRWVRLPQNLGIPGGHNAGVAAARGEFIALLDYDDIALPNRLERQMAHLKENPALGLVSSWAESIDERGIVFDREFSLRSAAAQRAYVLYAAPVVTPAYLGRREVFERFPYRPELLLAADFDFLTRAIETFSAEAVPAVLLHYRRHTNQTTQQKAAVIEEQRSVVRLLAARRRAGREEGLSAVCKQAGANLSPAEHSQRWADLALAEGFYPLAAYQVRRSLALNRSPRRWPAAALTALRVLVRAEGPARSEAMRLLLQGPVRGLGLRPE